MKLRISIQQFADLGLEELDQCTQSIDLLLIAMHTMTVHNT
jgi:hypothetical protein